MNITKLQDAINSLPQGGSGDRDPLLTQTVFPQKGEIVFFVVVEDDAFFRRVTTTYNGDKNNKYAVRANVFSADNAEKFPENWQSETVTLIIGRTVLDQIMDTAFVMDEDGKITGVRDDYGTIGKDLVFRMMRSGSGKNTEYKLSPVPEKKAKPLITNMAYEPALGTLDEFAEAFTKWQLEKDTPASDDVSGQF